MNQIPVISPCTGVCRMDDVTGWCLGCGRTTDEIATWGGAEPPLRAEIWAEIPRRLTQLGIACRRLPWTTQVIRDFAMARLQEGSGTWVMGVIGGVAEFTPAEGEPVVVHSAGVRITARTAKGALAMEIDDTVRALNFDPPGTPSAKQRVVLAVKRDKRCLRVAATVTRLGPDHARLIPEDPGTLFDLGLGRKEARFGLRCPPGEAIDALLAAEGAPLAESLPRLAPVLLRESPTRVIETVLGRIEVQGAIPPPGGRSPDGPHTHLLPDHLATGRALPVGMDLPRAYLPGAVFYP